MRRPLSASAMLNASGLFNFHAFVLLLTGDHTRLFMMHKYFYTH